MGIEAQRCYVGGAGNISNKLYQLGEMKRDDSLFRKSDTQIENVSFLLDKIMEVLADESH